MMDVVAFRFGLWLGVMAVVLIVGGFVIRHFRRQLLADDEEGIEEGPLYTTAEVERLRSEGQIDEAQYVKLMARVREAAKARARRERERRKRKRAIFG